MADKDWGLDCIKFYDNEGNCEEYTEKEYKRDLKRYLDKKDCVDKDEEGYFCKNMKRSVCENCLLHNEEYEYHSCISDAFTSFDTIKKIFVWAQEHPVTTNADKLKETFGDDVFTYIGSRLFHEDWVEEEYKEPSKEPK